MTLSSGKSFSVYQETVKGLTDKYSEVSAAISAAREIECKLSKLTSAYIDLSTTGRPSMQKRHLKCKCCPIQNQGPDGRASPPTPYKK